MNDPYITDDAHGRTWRFMLGDSCERLAELPDQSIDLSVYSPPFTHLYVYSPSIRDLGNCADIDEFIEHYSFIIREVLRLTKPGRLSAVHVAQVPLMKSRDGYVGLTDFRGRVISAHQEAGWIFWGEATVDKDPQAQAIRTKAQQLMFVSKNRDSSMIRPALADYLLLFKAPGDTAVPIKTDVTNDEWIEWARPVWLGIRESDTLQATPAREADDERHLAPLQLGFIERVVRLYSNPGETVLTPCGGIASELYVAVKNGRRAIGCELKPSYWQIGVQNLRALDELMSQDMFGGEL
jgi:DNA modification methylase